MLDPILEQVPEDDRARETGNAQERQSLHPTTAQEDQNRGTAHETRR